jgi:hypothetical protein
MIEMTNEGKIEKQHETSHHLFFIITKVPRRFVAELFEIMLSNFEEQSFFIYCVSNCFGFFPIIGAIVLRRLTLQVKWRKNVNS